MSIPKDFPPIVYVPLAEATSDVADARLQYRMTQDGRKALPAYSALDRLHDGMGASQPWAVFPHCIFRRSGMRTVFDTTLLSGLLTGGVTGGALANSAFALKSTRLINAERFASLTRSLADAAPDGKAVIPKTSYYQLLDDAGDAAKAVSAAQKALAGNADDLLEGVKAGSRLSKGLLVVGVLGTGYGIYDDMQNGESAAQAVTSNVGGWPQGWARPWSPVWPWEPLWVRSSRRLPARSRAPLSALSWVA